VHNRLCQRVVELLHEQMRPGHDLDGKVGSGAEAAE